MLNTPLLEDRHRQLAQDVIRFNRKQVRDTVSIETQDEQARRLVAALAGEGLLAYTVPERFVSGSNTLDYN